MSDNPLPLLKGKEVSIEGILGKSVSIIGYGNQGKAHALNLRDSGVSIRIGARNTTNAKLDGFEAVSIEEAATSELLIIALPDEVQPEVYEGSIEPHLQPGATLGFIHGFSVHFNYITPPKDIGAVLVAPKGPGITLRNRYLANTGVPALLAVHTENQTNTARSIALGWAAGIGSGRVGVLESSFAHETETDLFGEQSIIVGGLLALIRASYETLTNAGYPPELAYIECCHEVKQVADIVHEKGISKMLESISNTAEIGAYEAIDILDDTNLRNQLQKILRQVQDGSFAKRLVNKEISSKKDEFSAHEINRIGAEIRSLMLQNDD